MKCVFGVLGSIFCDSSVKREHSFCHGAFYSSSNQVCREERAGGIQSVVQMLQD